VFELLMTGSYRQGLDGQNDLGVYSI
jgi:hypothetical protein